MASAAEIAKTIKTDTTELLTFAVNSLKQLAKKSKKNIEAINTQNKIGAVYRIASIDFNETIRTNISIELESILAQQEAIETAIYKKFVVMKKKHEDMISHKIPDAWYQKTIKVITKENDVLKKEMEDCIAEFKQLAFAIEQRCDLVKYPHGVGEYVDGRDFIKYAKNMDLSLFEKVLQLKKVMDEIEE